jgi:hypothetical protein
MRMEGAVPIGAGGGYVATGPTVLVLVVVVMVVLALFMRWAFGPGGAGRRSSRRSPGPPPAAEDGLLTRIATLSSRESAHALRAVLSDAGIRSTVRFPSGRRTDVLVFGEDAERARALATTFGGGGGSGGGG